MMNNLSHKNLVVIDVETSGANPFIHEILAIGFSPIDKNIPSKTIFIRHEKIEWSNYAREIFSNYAIDWEEQAVAPVTACEEIKKYLSKYFQGQQVTPVGHNIGFDLSFLKKLAFQSNQENIAGISHRAVDTHTLLYFLALEENIPATATTSDGAFQYFGIKIKKKERHTAMGDAKATAELLKHVLERLEVTGRRQKTCEGTLPQADGRPSSN